MEIADLSVPLWIIALVIVIELIAVIYLVLRRRNKPSEQSSVKKKDQAQQATVLPYSETEAPLERGDVRELLGTIRSGFFAVLVITIAAWAVLYFLVEAEVLGYSIFAAIMIVFWIALVLGIQDMLRLIREDKKIILKGMIAERIEIIKKSGDSTDYEYFLRIGEEKLQVQDHIYKRYAEGQTIEFHFVRNRGGFPVLLKDKLILPGV